VFIGVLREPEFDSRVALTPDKKFPGFEFLVEKKAGERAGYSDAVYAAAGILIESRKAVLDSSKIVFTVNCPDAESIRSMRPGTVLVGKLDPLKNLDEIKLMARIGVSAFSIEFLPRITRAQFMDVLSSQSSLAGYQAVAQAAAMLGRPFPKMTTAAGNISPARILVIGAGVAGLQAIATAKRLGAAVSACDVRSSSKSEVESLGASFIEVHNDESGDDFGGYAKEMSEAYKKAQENKLLEIIGKQDIVITTAQIPNKPAPKIITKTMVDLMPENSLVVDLSGESGGNCELSVFSEIINYGTKRIFAPKGILNNIAASASSLFSSNLIAFAKTLFKFENNQVLFNTSDILIQSTLVTCDGVITHQALK
jgi:NAD(P) transhydrogenase subunit alpha